MAFELLTASIVLLTLFCASWMVYRFVKGPAEPLSLTQYTKLIFSGIIAFIADTLGIGSFAVNVALAKLFGTFHDDELPPMNNGAQVIPGAIEALFFMQIVNVDLTTLLVLVFGTCLGGVIGGYIVSYINKQAIRLAMVSCFFVIIGILLSHQFHLFSMGGDLHALHSWKLVIGFLGLALCGALTSFGIGLFVMVQSVLFLLNVSPEVAFPIMTIAGAMQQPLTTMVFLKMDKIPLKRTLVVSFAGCIGVLITIPVFKHLTINGLHLILIGILVFNCISIGRTYLQSSTNLSYLGKRRSLLTAE
jgi:uncharacterized membrane protein YfcA